MADPETPAPEPKYEIKPLPRRDIPFTRETFDRVCEMLGEGQSLRRIARDNLDLPTPGTFLKWLQDHADLEEPYVAARDRQQHAYADEQVDIADDDPDPARARNRIEARRWHASKLMPKVYGDRTQMDLGGNVRVEMPSMDAIAAALKGMADKL